MGQLSDCKLNEFESVVNIRSYEHVSACEVATHSADSTDSTDELSEVSELSDWKLSES